MLLVPLLTTLNLLFIKETDVWRRLGVLLSDWLEVPQEGAIIGHVPAAALAKEDGSLRPYGGVGHLQAGRGPGG